MDGLTTDQKTLNGGTLTSYRIPQELARRGYHRPEIRGPLQVLELARRRRVRQRRHPRDRYRARPRRVRGPPLGALSSPCSRTFVSGLGAGRGLRGLALGLGLVRVRRARGPPCK